MERARQSLNKLEAKLAAAKEAAEANRKVADDTANMVADIHDAKSVARQNAVVAAVRAQRGLDDRVERLGMRLRAQGGRLASRTLAYAEVDD